MFDMRSRMIRATNAAAQSAGATRPELLVRKPLKSIFHLHNLQLSGSDIRGHTHELRCGDVSVHDSRRKRAAGSTAPIFFGGVHLKGVCCAITADAAAAVTIVNAMPLRGRPCERQVVDSMGR